jgi:hypothetical protein
MDFSRSSKTSSQHQQSDCRRSPAVTKSGYKQTAIFATILLDVRKSSPDDLRKLKLLIEPSATSAPVEIIFSPSGLTIQPHRARMNNSLLETFVFLKCNVSTA